MDTSKVVIWREKCKHREFTLSPCYTIEVEWTRGKSIFIPTQTLPEDNAVYSFKKKLSVHAKPIFIFEKNFRIK